MDVRDGHDGAVERGVDAALDAGLIAAVKGDVAVAADDVGVDGAEFSGAAGDRGRVVGYGREASVVIEVDSIDSSVGGYGLKINVVAVGLGAAGLGERQVVPGQVGMRIGDAFDRPVQRSVDPLGIV